MSLNIFIITLSMVGVVMLFNSSNNSNCYVLLEK